MNAIFTLEEYIEAYAGIRQRTIEPSQYQLLVVTFYYSEFSITDTLILTLAEVNLFSDEYAKFINEIVISIGAGEYKYLTKNEIKINILPITFEIKSFLQSSNLTNKYFAKHLYNDIVPTGFGIR